MRVLVTGATGQDGSYLVQLHVEQGDSVFAMVRGQRAPSIVERPELAGARIVAGDLTDVGSLMSVLTDIRPDVIYNMAAVSAPAVGWTQPEVMMDVTGNGPRRLFDVALIAAPEARIVQAGSIARHGPYGVAKTVAAEFATMYRRVYGQRISTVLMTGHHSPRRGVEFFSRKVTRAVAEVVNGRTDKVVLGDLTRRQDWGWATDFVTVMAQVAGMLPDDYILGTDDPRTCEEWVATAFRVAGLHWRDHVSYDQSMNQPDDVPALTAEPDPRLDWIPRRDFEGLVESMVAADISRIRKGLL